MLPCRRAKEGLVIVSADVCMTDDGLFHFSKNLFTAAGIEAIFKMHRICNIRLRFKLDPFVFLPSDGYIDWRKQVFFCRKKSNLHNLEKYPPSGRFFRFSMRIGVKYRNWFCNNFQLNLIFHSDFMFRTESLFSISPFIFARTSSVWNMQ